MARKILGAQRDFSSGEIDIALKRSDDHPARKTGLRQMSNMRILNSAAIQNRPGRRALYPITNGCTRIEEFTITPGGTTYKIAFGPARIQIIDATGTIVQTFTTQGGTGHLALPWTALNLSQIVYTIFQKAIYLTFPGMRPQVISFDGVSTWAIADYTPLIVGAQNRLPFYRLAPAGVSMWPSGVVGTITVQFSAPVLDPAMFAGGGQITMRFVGRQLILTSMIDAENANATVQEPLPGGQTLHFTIGPTSTFGIGDVVYGTVSGARGVVTDFPGGGNMHVQLLSNSVSIQNTGFSTVAQAFIPADTVVGPSGSLQPDVTSSITPPNPCSVWDESVIGPYRGYPASCFNDQFRLGFCDFPALPNGICWSAINSPSDLYANDASSPSSAIFELAPDNVRVFYVVPGIESSEFVFCDRRLYYIKIDPSNPLKPGSVGFQTLSTDGCAQVKPRTAQELILYTNAGQNNMMAIVATGAYYRPFNTKNLSEFAGHLFNNVAAIALPNADSSFNERYAYVLNGDGSIAVGKYTLQDGQFTGQIGWSPWSGVGAVNWISAWDSDLLIAASYFGMPVCEILDDTQYLDAALPVNSLPAAFTPPGGKGPLWWMPSQTVTLMDQGTRSMGIYQIDANGFIVPQFLGGEDLTVASLVAGQSWTSIVEPFCPDANAGTDMGQRMFKRRISRFAAYVVHSTGFVMARLFAGPVTPTSPALGTVMNIHRVTAWNQGDDPTLPPPLRETAERWRPLGRAFDPRVAIIKDTPGPLQILELGMEASI